MIEGLFIFIGLLAVAVALLVLPMVRGRNLAQHSDQINHQQASRSWYADRVNELSEEVTDESIAREIEQDLASVFLVEAEVAAQQKMQMAGGLASMHVPSSRKSMIWAALCGVVFAVVAVGVYMQTANPALPQLIGAQEIVSLSAQTQQVELRSWQRKLSGYIALEPSDSQSRYLLGLAEFKLGNFPEAAQLFAATDAQIEGDPTVKLYWFQAQYLADKGVLTPTTKEIAEAILVTQPNHSEILEILAIDAFQQQRPLETVQLLNRAVTGTNDVNRQRQLSEVITRVRATLTEPPAGITVFIHATEQSSQGGTLFLVARPVGGGMPFAALRRPASMLPLTLRLDDLVSMSPQRRLSSADAFEVVARVSLAGATQRNPSDLIWTSPPLSTADTLSGGRRLEAVLASVQAEE